MIFQSLCLGFLPLLDAVGGLVSSLRSSLALHHTPSQHGGQFIHGLGNEETEVKSSSNHVADDNNSDPLDLWQLWTLDLLDTSHVHVDLVFPCACNLSSAPIPHRPQPKKIRRKPVVFGGESGGRHDGGAFSFRRLVARHERHLTCAAVVAALQVFLRLTRANATTLFLPLLSQATFRGGGAAAAARAGDAVLVLVSACGVLGSARAARDLGREAMCAIGGVLVVLCQVAVPAVAALGGGGRAMAGGHAAAMFAAACAASGGFSWAWGALFWAVPGEGVRSAGQAAGAALGFGLGFAQMQCFLLTLRQLKHAAFAYYAVWIWS
ncbi:unnamed protein product [Urochloa humidicola]